MRFHRARFDGARLARAWKVHVSGLETD